MVLIGRTDATAGVIGIEPSSPPLYCHSELRLILITMVLAHVERSPEAAVTQLHSAKVVTSTHSFVERLFWEAQTRYPA